MNFIEEFKKGQSGGNKGLPMGEGLDNISQRINGVQRQRIYGVAASPKAGKSTFVDYAFLISPYLYAVENNILHNIEWIYFSFEIDRVSKEFDIATYFLYYDFGITHVSLDEGITKHGENIIELSPNYLRGRVQDDKGNIIKVKDTIIEALKIVYEKRIVPMFGEYSQEGIMIKKGCIIFVEARDNPTGLRNYLIEYAKQYGRFRTMKMGKGERIIGYYNSNPDRYTIIITDHLRKLLIERGYVMKTNVDKYIEYTVELRNWCQFTFVHIIHTNRDIVSMDRMRFAKNMLYPTSDDVKDTGNLAEDADYLFTMFNPNDTRYNLKKHFDLDIRDDNNYLLFPNLRTLHLVESRHCEFPQHFSVNMYGNLKTFEKLVI